MNKIKCKQCGLEDCPAIYKKEVSPSKYDIDEINNLLKEYYKQNKVLYWNPYSSIDYTYYKLNSTTSVTTSATTSVTTSATNFTINPICSYENPVYYNSYSNLTTHIK